MLECYRLFVLMMYFEACILFVRGEITTQLKCISRKLN